MEGLDHNWVEAGTRRTAYDSHVPPGEYVFKVMAANSDGVWNAEGRSLRVVALSPFYQTWWFVALAALGVGAASSDITYDNLHDVPRRRGPSLRLPAPYPPCAPWSSYFFAADRGAAGPPQIL